VAQEDAASAGPVARLRMRFSADSWVEIYDATGRRLLFDQGSAGAARSVTGVPPLRVLLGNYAGVELTLDGRPVDVPERSRTGATARFRVMPGGTTLSFWGS
jgi:cytoskeleton protein RodZ